MKPPPGPAFVVAGGLAWNLGRARRNRRVAPADRKRTISRWICASKKIAVPLAIGGGTWVAWHWWRYVIDADPT